MALKDYYRSLGVSPLASQEEIHKSYRLLAKKYHPDICKEKILADEMMKEITEAYNKLKDHASRKEYDSRPHFKFREFKRSTLNVKKAGFLEKLFPKKDDRKKRDGKPARNPIEESFYMGFTYVQMRKPDSLALAIQEFDSIIKIDAKIADAYYNLGLCHYLLGDYEKSIMAFKKVLNVNPKDEQAKTMSSLLYDQQQ